jgi:multiple sugar transport system substrate-binding protein
MNFKQIIFVSLISLIIIVFIIIVFIYIPSNNHKNPDLVETTIHYVSHISEAHQKVIDRFNSKYKGKIKIETINLPFEKFSTNERKELLARFLRSKSDRIDVFTVDQIWVPRFARWAFSLEKYFNNEERKQLLKSGMQTCFFNDSLIAIPLYIDIAVMFYRNDLLSEMPDNSSLRQKLNKSISWTDLINLSYKYDKQSNPMFLFPADNYEGLMCMFVEMMESQGKSLIENGELQLSSTEAYNSLALMVDLVNKYRIAPKEVVNSKENETYNLFLKNSGLFLRGWPAFLTEYPKLALEKDIKTKIDIAPTPHFKSGKPVSVFGGWNLMISKFSPHFEESIIFIKYLLSEEAQLIMYQDGGYLPINESNYENELDQRLLFYKQLINSGVHRPFLENYTKISDIIVEFLNQAIKKELSVNQALMDAEKRISNENIEIK